MPPGLGQLLQAALSASTVGAAPPSAEQHFPSMAQAGATAGLVPAVDSVFGALGPPSNPIEFQSPLRGRGQFNLGTGQIHVAPPQGLSNAGREDFPGIVAHELVHDIALGGGDSPEDFTKSANLFAELFRGLRPVQQKALFEDYFGSLKQILSREGETPERATPAAQTEFLKGIAEDGLASFEMQEILAKSFERGYQIARKADPQDPSKTREELQSAEEKFPLTALAFNFFVRNFPQEFQRGN